MPPESYNALSAADEESWPSQRTVTDDIQIPLRSSANRNVDFHSSGSENGNLNHLSDYVAETMDWSRMGRYNNDTCIRLGENISTIESGGFMRSSEGSSSPFNFSSEGNSYLPSQFGQFQVSNLDPVDKLQYLRNELKVSREAQAALGEEVISLRGELRTLLSMQSDQTMEISRLRREVEYADKTKMEQAGKISALHSMLDALNSTDFIQLEDFSIQALQAEMKAESRRGVIAQSSLIEPPLDYTGCRQFFQTGYCHFGRGRRPCPNVNSHLCLHCGREHGTAPHLILLQRMRNRTLNVNNVNHGLN